MVSGMTIELPINSQCDELDDPSPKCIQLFHIIVIRFHIKDDGWVYLSEYKQTVCDVYVYTS